MKRFIPILLSSLLSLLPGCSRGDGGYPQITDIPSLYIETEDAHPIDSKETYLSCRVVLVEKGGRTLYDSVQVRGRGNSTWMMSPKKPYRLKFRAAIPLLGEGHATSRDWTLLANHGDKTLLRNALTEDLGAFAGLPFRPGARFVDLVVNGEYLGNYQISDQVQAAKGRIPVDKKTGWVLETSGKWNLEKNNVTTSHGYIYNIMNPKGGNLTTTKAEEIRSFLERMEDSILSEDFTDPVKGYRSMIDVESLVTWYVACEVSGNLDALLSIYMYKEDKDPRMKFGPMWDMDFAYDRSGEASLLREMEAFVPFEDRPFQFLIQRLWMDPYFAHACKAKLDDMVGRGLERYLDSKIDSLVALTTLSREENFRKWSISEKVYSWEKPLYHDTYEEYIADLKEYLEIHIPYLQERFTLLAENSGR